MDDQLDLLGSPAPATAAQPGAATSGSVGAATAIMGGTSMGMGMGEAPVALRSSFPPFQAWSKGGLTLTFTCAKDPSNATVTNIEATFTNTTGAPMDGLNFQVAVPKYMQLKMTPPTSTTIPPVDVGVVKQVFKVANSLQGQKPILLKVKLEYSTMGHAVSEVGSVDNFPAGC